MLYGYTRHISILAVAAALGLAGGTALAASAPENHGASADAASSLHTKVPHVRTDVPKATQGSVNLKVKSIVGKVVYGPRGAPLGKISNIVRSRVTHDLTAVVKTGGSTNRSSRSVLSVVVPANRLKVAGPQAMTELTRNELRAMPAYHPDLYTPVPDGKSVNTMGMNG